MRTKDGVFEIYAPVRELEAELEQLNSQYDPSVRGMSSLGREITRVEGKLNMAIAKAEKEAARIKGKDSFNARRARLHRELDCVMDRLPL